MVLEFGLPLMAFRLIHVQFVSITVALSFVDTGLIQFHETKRRWRELWSWCWCCYRCWVGQNCCTYVSIWFSLADGLSGTVRSDRKRILRNAGSLNEW
jgi:hypothetical protein